MSVKYSEHERLHAVKEQSQRLGEFLDWLGENGYFVCEFAENYGEYAPTSTRIEQILADYFDVDLDAIEREKREMIAELRGNTPEARAELGLAPEEGAR